MDGSRDAGRGRGRGRNRGRCLRRTLAFIGGRGEIRHAPVREILRRNRVGVGAGNGCPDGKYLRRTTIKGHPAVEQIVSDGVLGRREAYIARIRYYVGVGDDLAHRVIGTRARSLRK